MKKVLIYFIIIILLTITGCNNSNYNKLTIIDNDNLLLNDVNIIYKTGDLVTLKVKNDSEFGSKVVLNGTELYGEGNEELYIVEFNMPNIDSIIEISIMMYEDTPQPGLYVSLNTLLPWINEIDEESIETIRYEYGNIGVAPGSFANIMYSSDMEDINSIYKLINSYVYRTDELITPGGSYEKYDIRTSNSNYSLEIVQDIIEIDNKLYKFVENKSGIENPYKFCNSLHYIDEYEVYYNSVLVGKYTNLSKIEFKELPMYDDGDTLDPLIEPIIPYFITTPYFTMCVTSPRLFSISDDGFDPTFYEIVGENDFTFLFDNRMYLKDVMYATAKNFELNISLKDGVTSCIIGLDNIVTDSLQDLFNTELSDEYLKANYRAILFIRVESYSTNILDNVYYSELFYENYKFYVTRTYNHNGYFIGDAAFSYYQDIILIPNYWCDMIENPCNFEIEINSKTIDGKTIFNKMSYEKLNKLKEYIKKIGQNEFPYITFYENAIDKALGEYNDAFVFYPYEGSVADCISSEIIFNFEFIYHGSRKILVFYNNNIVTLEKAVADGILSIDNIRVIYYLFNDTLN